MITELLGCRGNELIRSNAEHCVGLEVRKGEERGRGFKKKSEGEVEQYVRRMTRGEGGLIQGKVEVEQ